MPWWFKSKKAFDISDPSDRDSFFVVTAIFNPAGFTSRYDLYHKFVSHMAQCGVQLMTVEAIFPSLGQNEFQVTQANNPLHVQVRSPSVYWMKENLINLGVSKLPPHAKWVAWLDADITFEDKNWMGATLTALKKYEVVQVFKKAKFLGPPPEGKVLRTDYGFGYSVVHDKIIDQERYAEWYPHPGYGWAMTISSYRAISGLPVHDIVGSGDLHFAFSLLNRVSNAVEDQLHPEFKSLILQISNRTFETLSSMAKATGKQGIVGYAPVTLRHNWHGSRSDRQYVDRWKILIAHQFNFREDVEKNDESGLLEFVGGKSDALQRDILTHFRIRKEDGKEVSGQDLAVVALAAGGAMKKHDKKKKKAGRKGSNSSSDDDRRKKNMGQTTTMDNLAWMPPTDPNCPPCIPCPDSTCPPCVPCPDPHCHYPPGHDHHHEHGDDGHGHDDHHHDDHHYGDGGYSEIHTSTQY